MQSLQDRPVTAAQIEQCLDIIARLTELMSLAEAEKLTVLYERFEEELIRLERTQSTLERIRQRNARSLESQTGSVVQLQSVA